MPTQEKRLDRIVKKTSSPTVSYSPVDLEYNLEYAKRKEEEVVYSGLLWHNKQESKNSYPFVIRDNYADVLYIKLDDKPNALNSFVGKPVHILGKNVRLEDKVNALLVKEVKPCTGKCNVFKF